MRNIELMTDEIHEALLRAGLSEQQTKNTSVRVCIETIANMESEGLVDIAKRYVDNARSMENQALRDRQNAWDNARKIKADAESEAKEIINKAVDDAKDITEEITDAKAREAVKLFTKIITTAKRHGASGADACEQAGYIVYAYLGGEAKKDMRSNCEYEDDYE